MTTPAAIKNIQRLAHKYFYDNIGMRQQGGTKGNAAGT